jgi:hypothetical protein
MAGSAATSVYKLFHPGAMWDRVDGKPLSPDGGKKRILAGGKRRQDVAKRESPVLIRAEIG